MESITNIIRDLLSWLVGVAADIGLKLLSAGLILLVGSLLIKFLLKHFPDGKKFSHLDPTVKGFLRSFVSIALWVILLVCIVAVLGVPMASVIAAIASCGVAIGLAMQGSLSNFAGGIMLLIFRPFNVGDFIETSDNSGTVQEIGIFYTVLITADNKHVTIPNGTMMNNVVINYSREKNRRVDMEFSIEYEADADRACEIALATARAHEKVLTDPAPFSRVTSLGDSAVTVTVRVWADSSDFWTVKFDLISRIRKDLEAEGIKAAYPHMDINVINNK